MVITQAWEEAFGYGCQEVVVSARDATAIKGWVSDEQRTPGLGQACYGGKARSSPSKGCTRTSLNSDGATGHRQPRASGNDGYDLSHATPQAVTNSPQTEAGSVIVGIEPCEDGDALASLFSVQGLDRTVTRPIVREAAVVVLNARLEVRLECDIY